MASQRSTIPGPDARISAAKSVARSEPLATFAEVTALSASSAVFTAPSLICLDLMLSLASPAASALPQRATNRANTETTLAKLKRGRLLDNGHNLLVAGPLLVRQ